MLQYPALQDYTEWKRKLYFQLPELKCQGTFSASAAVPETSAYVPNPLMPEDVKHLTAFPQKANGSITHFVCLNKILLNDIEKRRKRNAFFFLGH